MKIKTCDEGLARRLQAAGILIHVEEKPEKGGRTVACSFVSAEEFLEYGHRLSSARNADRARPGHHGGSPSIRDLQFRSRIAVGGQRSMA